MNPTDHRLSKFVSLVWDHYRLNKRHFDWRENTRPYSILVSEIMLQQTQTSRVAQKFPVFLARFPNFSSLANASLIEVLSAWQGLGYNRRGRYLHETAKIICAEYQGVLPADPQILRTFPGIGTNTAASILAFAFNIPEVFIETNIRSVFIHHFFPESPVHDRDILPLVKTTLDLENPREWYWALMDYGVYLKKTHGNSARKSVHYVRQSVFEGSVRQARGRILKILIETPDAAIPLAELPESPVYGEALAGLEKEGMIVAEGVGEKLAYRLPS